MSAVTGISGIQLSAASAAYAPTNSAEVSAIASAYATGKQDALTFGYDADSLISSIDGSAIAGGGGGASYTSPSGTIIVGADTLEGTDSGVGVTYLTSFQKSGYFGTTYGPSASGSSNYPTVFNLSGSAGALGCRVSSNGVYYTSIPVEQLNGTVVIPSGSWRLQKNNSAPMYWTAENYYSGTANVQLAHKSDVAVSSITRARIVNYDVSPAATSTSVSAINGESIYAESAKMAYSAQYAMRASNGTPLSAMITATPYSKNGTINVTGLEIEGSDSAFLPSPYVDAGTVTLTPHEWESSESAQYWSNGWSVSPADKISRIGISSVNNYGSILVEMRSTSYEFVRTSVSVNPYNIGIVEVKAPFYPSYITLYVTSQYSASAISSITVTAYSQESGTVVPLAHASSLPTYGYDGTAITSIDGSAIGGAGGGIDSATCSSIASSYAESAASSKLDTTAFNSGDFYTTANESGYVGSAYVDSAVSGKADSSALSSYALSADVSGTVDLVSTQSANWGGSALALSAGPGVKLEKVGDTLVASTDETVLFSGSNSGMVATPLTEPLSGFDSFKICFNPFTSNGMSREWKEFSWAGSSDVYTVATFYRAQNDNLAWYVAFQPNSDGTTITPIANKLNTLGTSAVQDRTQIHVYKVVGINRTAEA